MSLYIHLVDNSFYSVIARNNINNPVVIPKYLRLGTVAEIEYDNYYLINIEEVDFILEPAS